jgi:thiol-disulfide isomerase/thioredoxin
MRTLVLILVAGSCCLAQETASEVEERQLGRALSEAGSSPIEFMRALETHLKKFPKTERLAEIERALVKAAIENNDERRIALYGQRVLEREPDELEILDRVARALLRDDTREAASRALNYARRSEKLLSAMRNQKPSGRMAQGRWEQQVDRGVARALVLQARASGRLGKTAEATRLAEDSFRTFPSVEAARQAGRWLATAGRTEEAVRRYAEAFAMADPAASDLERAADRARVGELYRKLKGTETGLGDVILEAYDRTAALEAERRARLAESEPNANVSSLLDFTLSGLNGDKLELKNLRGKTVVFDFWATWCGPCRTQYPLYEEVKRRFRDRPEVVFLSVNTDEERSVVEPFLKEVNWSRKVYFEDGLSKTLRVSSIPTTIILNKRGEVVSRLNGFLPDRFVDMLTERIQEALQD